jgi:hypothetical protein
MTSTSISRSTVEQNIRSMFGDGKLNDDTIKYFAKHEFYLADSVENLDAARMRPLRTFELKARAFDSWSLTGCEPCLLCTSVSVSSTRAVNLPLYQRSIQCIRRLRMSLARLTPGIVCKTTATNTRGRSEFHVWARTPWNSSARMLRKRRPTILYVGDWQADNPPPPPLPGCVSLLDTSSQVTVIVLMGSVSVDRLKELVGRHRLGAGPVSPRVFAKDRALHDVLWTCRVVRWKGRDKLWVPSGLGMGL